ncbi:hypothetical protein NECAME_05966 [Necator americanus]|uniref:C2 domain-containing protein n=1 Tax=Necator americanus TaxID=51031 RepID=W2TXR7_NECAM|nr:hypothetical protein NECAME_05966 [Necator americanus]ETN86474.1 hypothetical protein NECAME_05966 [Necator americanus]
MEFAVKRHSLSRIDEKPPSVSLRLKNFIRRASLDRHSHNGEVYDYDRFCTDDFMGCASIDISQVKWFQPSEKIVDLVDDASPTEELGTISLTISVVPLTMDEKDEASIRF